MARSRLCRACKDFHDIEAPWPDACAAHFGVQANDAPNIRADGMDPVRSMVSGKLHDSKSAYYREVRAAGCEIVGNDRAGYGSPPQHNIRRAGHDIKRAIEELSSR